MAFFGRGILGEGSKRLCRTRSVHVTIIVNTWVINCKNFYNKHSLCLAELV